jgi:hypothetical protein
LFQSSKTRSLSEFMNWCELEIKELERTRSQNKILSLGFIFFLGFIVYDVYEPNMDIDLRFVAASISLMFVLLMYFMELFMKNIEINQLRLSQTRARYDFGDNSEDWEMHQKDLDIQRKIWNDSHGDDRKDLIRTVLFTIIFFSIIGAVLLFLRSY